MPIGFPYAPDITEIHGFDDLSNPLGILKETADLAARLYGSDNAFLLVNGSTVGILTAIGAHAKRGEKILFPKSCHRSVYNSAKLFGLEAVLFTPETDTASGIDISTEPQMIEAALDLNPDIKLIVITSPSYEGVVSDIRSIADIAHSRGAILLVDSAHGAHLGFSDRFPMSAIQCGADIVVMSLHKTLPALTQCSLLHLCSDRTNIEETNRLLFTLQTSSPSYVFMSSIDYCLRLLDSDKDKLFDNYERMLTRFYNDVKDLRKIGVFGAKKGGFKCPSNPDFFAFDPGKIVIVTKRTAMSGKELADILRKEHKIELEAAHADYAIAMTSICDTQEGFERLAKALIAIDGGVK
jgi:arginine/lysine/ornithine decarboxylase